MDWYDWVRLATSGISLAAMYFLGRNWVRRKTIYSARLRDFWWAMNCMLLAVIVINVEKILRDHELTWSLAVSFLASIVCLKAAHSKNTILLVKADPELVLTDKNQGYTPS